MKPYNARLSALTECTGPTEQKEVGELLREGRMRLSTVDGPGLSSRAFVRSSAVQVRTRPSSLGLLRTSPSHTESTHVITDTRLESLICSILKVATKRGFYKALSYCAYITVLSECKLLVQLKTCPPTFRLVVRAVRLGELSFSSTSWPFVRLTIRGPEEDGPFPFGLLFLSVLPQK